MTKEQLEALGLSEEQIKEIFRLNGIAVNNAKGELDTKVKEVEALQGQLSTANKEIEGFKELNVEEIQKKADEYKEKFEEAEIKAKEELEKIQFEHELENAIKDSGARSVKAVKALLDIEELRDSKNRSEDIKKALEVTAEENDFLFTIEDGGDSPYFTRPGGGGKPTEMTKEEFNKLSYVERNEIFNTNKSLYDKLTK